MCRRSFARVNKSCVPILRQSILTRGFSDFNRLLLKFWVFCIYGIMVKFTMEIKPIIRFTIGPASKSGFECLERAISQIQKLYSTDIVICHNCEAEQVSHLGCTLFDQRTVESETPPMGVAWKLYPPRLDLQRHEILIDNDIILEERVAEIDQFLQSDEHCLLLEGESRTYGRFQKHVPARLKVNSGIYGMPPGFDFATYVKSYSGKEWEINATGTHAQSKTFDEQGLVAFVLGHQKHFLIPNTTVTNCEKRWIKGKGMHFVGLNRTESHKPYKDYLKSKVKIHC